MQVDTIYDPNINVHLYYITHISNGDICGVQHEMAKMRISDINTVIAYELSSATNS